MIPTRGRLSVRPTSGQYGCGRTHEDSKIEYERARPNVFGVKLLEPAEIGFASAGDLPEAREPRAYGTPDGAKLGAQCGQWFRLEGTRPDERHVTAEDVPELR